MTPTGKSTSKILNLLTPILFIASLAITYFPTAIYSVEKASTSVRFIFLGDFTQTLKDHQIGSLTTSTAWVRGYPFGWMTQERSTALGLSPALQNNLLGLIADIVFWFAVSIVIILVLRRVLKPKALPPVIDSNEPKNNP